MGSTTRRRPLPLTLPLRGSLPLPQTGEGLISADLETPCLGWVSAPNLRNADPNQSLGDRRNRSIGGDRDPALGQAREVIGCHLERGQRWVTHLARDHDAQRQDR